MVLVSSFEVLAAVAAFESFFEGAFIELRLAEDESTKTISFVVFPLPIVDEAWLVDLSALAVFIPVWKLTEIDGALIRAVVDLEDSEAVPFVLVELPLVDEFSLLVLDTFPWFLSLTVHEGLPPSEVDLPFVVQNYVVFRIDAEVRAIFVFFDSEHRLSVL